jgi:hypothetical protein
MNSPCHGALCQAGSLGSPSTSTLLGAGDATARLPASSADLAEAATPQSKTEKAHRSIHRLARRLAHPMTHLALEIDRMIDRYRVVQRDERARRRVASRRELFLEGDYSTLRSPEKLESSKRAPLLPR